jgi:hypothetical protein
MLLIVVVVVNSDGYRGSGDDGNDGNGGKGAGSLRSGVD